MTWRRTIEAHYARTWQTLPIMSSFTAGPIDQLPSDFEVVKFPPRPGREMWTYATVGMSHPDDEKAIELHLYSPHEANEHVELLFATAHYHRNEARLGLWHTVNFGRPWLGRSLCNHGFVSLPYLDGPSFEILNTPLGPINFYWLIPVHAEEVTYKAQQGVEALEQAFENESFNYLDPSRPSAVPKG